MPEIPGWIEARLDDDLHDDLQNRTLVEIFLEDERPFLSRRQIEDELSAQGITVSKDTTNRHLNQLVEDEILKEAVPASGSIYWINWPETDWPKPPDVTIEPTSNETTLKEFVGRTPVKVTGGTILFTMAGSFLIFAALLIALIQPDSTGGVPNQLIVGGVFIVFVSYLLLIASIFYWLSDIVR